MTIDPYIHYWAQLIRESSDDYTTSELLDEMAGHKNFKDGNDRVGVMVQNIIDHVLVTTDKNKQVISMAFESDKELTDAKDFKNKKYAVINVSRLSKPYDIIVQKLEKGKIGTYRIEAKSSEKSSMFEKKLTFKHNKIGLAADGEDTEYWNNLFAEIPKETTRQLNLNVANLMKQYRTLLKQHQKSPADKTKSFGDNDGVVQSVMDQVVESGKKLTQPFKFNLDLLTQHFLQVSYIEINGEAYTMREDDNPLNLTNKEGADLRCLQDDYANSNASFYIKKRENSYVILLHVYGLNRKPKQPNASFLDSKRCPVVRQKP